MGGEAAAGIGSTTDCARPTMGDANNQATQPTATEWCMGDSVRRSDKSKNERTKGAIGAPTGAAAVAESVPALGPHGVANSSRSAVVAVVLSADVTSRIRWCHLWRPNARGEGREVRCPRR